jgi:hypothetical protein
MCHIIVRTRQRTSSLPMCGKYAETGSVAKKGVISSHQSKVTFSLSSSSSSSLQMSKLSVIDEADEPDVSHLTSQFLEPKKKTITDTLKITSYHLAMDIPRKNKTVGSMKRKQFHLQGNASRKRIYIFPNSVYTTKSIIHSLCNGKKKQLTLVEITAWQLVRSRYLPKYSRTPTILRRRRI